HPDADGCYPHKHDAATSHPNPTPTPSNYSATSTTPPTAHHPERQGCWCIHTFHTREWTIGIHVDS
ncbi:MAG: hypothetical protein OXF41_10225, partial [bacterium]|nr:hypothetical protein [bacterium]